MRFVRKGSCLYVVRENGLLDWAARFSGGRIHLVSATYEQELYERGYR